MADALTTNYDLVKPEIGGSQSTWGNKLNSNFDLIDQILHDLQTSIPDGADFEPKRTRISSAEIAAGTSNTIRSVAPADLKAVVEAHSSAPTNLDASAITSGTFAAARIPDLNASKITAGTLADARIPNLNASKITSGTLPVARGGTGQTTEAGMRGVYTGSSVNNTNFPIGTSLSVADGSQTSRNGSARVILHGSLDYAFQTSSSGGTALSGTWRQRGNGHFQRVA